QLDDRPAGDLFFLHLEYLEQALIERDHIALDVEREHRVDHQMVLKAKERVAEVQVGFRYLERLNQTSDLGGERLEQLRALFDRKLTISVSRHGVEGDGLCIRVDGALFSL